MTSPAERYQASRERAQRNRAAGGDTEEALWRFAESLDFTLDDFQRTACSHLAGGSDVLVAAPTGAGKTVVGEFAVFLALERGLKAFYTTPIKALSNQKYLDLARAHGSDRVGLLTGDVSINADAPVLVMTTEVLRNMIYADSPALRDLGYVVMDEVHYLADAARGGVWEEVILLLAERVRLASLSATVSNAEEFGSWLQEVRGATAVVVSEQRPVPLWQHMMVRHDLFDLYTARVDASDPGLDPAVNPELMEAVRRAERSAPGSGDDGAAGRGRGGGGSRGGRGGSRHGRGGGRGRLAHQARGNGTRSAGRAGARGGVRPARREVVVDRLDRAGLLPAIVFVFSRAGCEAAVDQLLGAGTRLTTEAERRRIAEVLHELSLRIPAEDLEAVGFSAFAAAASRGVAAHHAGMLPAFKEAVEALFTRGLVKVVFATETLALGINMPARSVVLERLVKWDGRGHNAVTPGEYTQLTGRAGRRGIDVEGHAIVLYATGVDPLAVVGLASRRTYPLRSSFRPTYNMAVNLLQSRERGQVRELLEQSFAQYQADASVVHLARQLRRHEEALAGYRSAAHCDQADISDYLQLQQRISALESEGQRERAGRRRRAVADQLGSLRPGDVVEIPRGRRSGWAVVVGRVETELAGPVVPVLGQDRTVHTLTAPEVPHGVRVAGRVRIPRDFNARDPRARRDLASSLRNAIAAGLAPGELPSTTAGQDEAELTQLRRALRSHPVHGCAQREDHLRWARRADQVSAEMAKLQRRIAGRTSSIARDFDRVCQVLLTLGYLAEPGRVTPEGAWLRRLYAERDLVLAETLRSGAWDSLDAAELAAAASTVVFSSRGDEDGPRPIPLGLGQRLTTAVETVLDTGARIEALEKEAGLTPSPAVDVGLVRTMLSWARGAGLGDVLAAGELSAGDLVRWARQVLDVLDQLTVAAPTTALRARAREAMDLVRRGVVGQDLV